MPLLPFKFTAQGRLHRAAEEGSMDRLRQALAEGALANEATFHASWHRQTGVHLEKNWLGKEVSVPTTTLEANIWTTPLLLAMERGDAPMVEVLVQSGADPWAPGIGHNGHFRRSAVYEALHSKPSMLPCLGAIDALARAYDQALLAYPGNPSIEIHHLRGGLNDLPGSNALPALEWLEQFEVCLAAYRLDHATANRAPVSASRRL